MTLQIREGTKYVTRGGKVLDDYRKSGVHWDFSGDWDSCHSDTGKYLGGDPSLDIVYEWSEPAPQEAGPVRTETVTRMVIVPGVYDSLLVGGVMNGTVYLRMHFGDEGRKYSAEQIEALLPYLTSIAKALRDQP